MACQIRMSHTLEHCAFMANYWNWFQHRARIPVTAKIHLTADIDYDRDVLPKCVGSDPWSSHCGFAAQSAPCHGISRKIARLASE